MFYSRYKTKEKREGKTNYGRYFIMVKHPEERYYSSGESDLDSSWDSEEE
jgi:hypothetical protein